MKTKIVILALALLALSSVDARAAWRGNQVQEPVIVDYDPPRRAPVYRWLWWAWFRPLP